jgi:hypothetical protein
LTHHAKGDFVKARLCVLLVILGLAGAAAPTALAADDDTWDGPGVTWGYHDGDDIPVD